MDPFGRIMWWLFSSSTGAPTRVRIARALREEPRNAQQLAKSLDLDYMTVRRHLDVLRNNRMVETSGGPYGQVYFPSGLLEAHWTEFDRMVERPRRGREREP